MSYLEDTENAKLYIKKLIRLITDQADLNLIKYRIVQKRKIDDIMCCLLASLPDKYKKILSDSRSDLPSRKVYLHISSDIRKKFILSSDHYIINFDDIIRSLNVFYKTIAKDIEWAEKNYN